MSNPNIVPVGDRALAIYFKEEMNQEINKRVQQLGEWIKKKKSEAIEEVIPAYRTLTIVYNPLLITYQSLVEMIEPGFEEVEVSKISKQKILEVPVCYEEEFALDLEDLSIHTQLSVEEIISRHTSHPYYIYMLGFLPGFPYLGGLDSSLAMPRLANPRTTIKAGSVGIAGEQTGVYTMDSPGGWRIIGKTPLNLFDPNRDEPIPYQAGEWIEFTSVSKKEFVSIKRAVDSGTYQWKRKEVVHDIGSN